MVRCGNHDLGFGLYQLVKVGGNGRPFLAGFVATGALATLIYFDCCQLFYGKALRTQQWTLAPISAIVTVDQYDFMNFRHLGPGGLTTRKVLYSVIMAPIVTGMIALPQLLLAVVGGFVVQRLTNAHGVVTRL